MISISVNLLDINDNYILLSIDPPLTGLKKEDIYVDYNGSNYRNFTIIDESSSIGATYRITLGLVLTQYDYISVTINKEGYLPGKILIYMSRLFQNHNAKFGYILPNNAKGSFKIMLQEVNGANFNLYSEPLTASLPLKPEACIARLKGSDTYYIDENILIDIKLMGIDDSIVPDSQYVIGVEINSV